jgi:23S rRNA (adenine2503-C2)-methyltransferase
VPEKDTAMKEVMGPPVEQSARWTNIKEVRSSDEHVTKFVFTKEGDAPAVAEAVLYKYPNYEDRTVICCSTQSGCPVGCRFCGAGDAFVRSLTTEEIIEQPRYLLETTGVDPNKIQKLQIMFMSMGEPMLNQKKLIPALRTLHTMYPNAALLVSTSGPKVDYQPFIELSQEIPAIGLQFSVHESTDEARNALIPFLGKLPIAEIATTGRQWAEATGRQPFFNYCVHDQNNTDEDVERLSALFDPAVWQATLSVICERDESVAAANKRQRELTAHFMAKIVRAGYSARMFDPAGQDDIGGGCGQLWFVQEWMQQHPEDARKSIGFGKPVIHAPLPDERAL